MLTLGRRSARSLYGARARAATCAVLLVTTTACTTDLPASVEEGSTVRVGWSQDLTSLNASTTTGATEGNREIAAATHDAFARLADGEVVTDESFGTVEVLDVRPSSFTVRYDLAERSWSDAIPIDAADLLLAWAAGSKATAGEFDSLPTALRSSTTTVPVVDEFARRIDVTYAGLVREWQTALDVAVPAHVVGELAWGIEDPMEAKQAVMDAITDGNDGDLTAIAEVWNTGFDLEGIDGDVPSELTVASGPYRVARVEGAGSAADQVTLEVNREYDGNGAPTFEQVDLVDAGSALDEFPADLDVVQLSPTAGNFSDVRELERRDHNVATSHTGRLWALVLRADRGVFRAPEARRAFLRATPRTDVRAAGAGAWESAYATTQSLLFPPESSGYQIALEDAGFRAAFEGGDVDAAAERAAAGLGAGTKVCVLYDTEDPFAADAFAAVQAGAAEAGWTVADCGRRDVERAIRKQRGWQAVLTTVALPESTDDITQVWGGAQSSPLTGTPSPERAQLVADLARTTDPYDARDLLVLIEAELIKESLALPLALEPVLTLSARGFNLVQPESGSSVTLLADVSSWAPER